MQHGLKLDLKKTEFLTTEPTETENLLSSQRFTVSHELFFETITLSLALQTLQIPITGLTKGCLCSSWSCDRVVQFEKPRCSDSNVVKSLDSTVSPQRALHPLLWTSRNPGPLESGRWGWTLGFEGRTPVLGVSIGGVSACLRKFSTA